eukprot:scaffold426162_cov22-Prasinocladus_malaysianus.AAC.1
MCHRIRLLAILFDAFNICHELPQREKHGSGTFHLLNRLQFSRQKCGWLTDSDPDTSDFVMGIAM